MIVYAIKSNTNNEFIDKDFFLIDRAYWTPELYNAAFFIKKESAEHEIKTCKIQGICVAVEIKEKE